MCSYSPEIIQSTLYPDRFVVRIGVNADGWGSYLERDGDSYHSSLIGDYFDSWDEANEAIRKWKAQ